MVNSALMTMMKRRKMIVVTMVMVAVIVMMVMMMMMMMMMVMVSSWVITLVNPAPAAIVLRQPVSQCKQLNQNHNMQNIFSGTSADKRTFGHSSPVFILFSAAEFFPSTSIYMIHNQNILRNLALERLIAL